MIVWVVVRFGERIEINFGEGIWLALRRGAVWVDDGGRGSAALSTVAGCCVKAGWTAASSIDATATTTTAADA